MSRHSSTSNFNGVSKAVGIIARRTVSIFTVLISLGMANTMNAQWGADVRLTNASGSSSTRGGRSIAAAGEILHVVWEDQRHGNSEIYYKASDNGGLTWTADARLTNNPNHSHTPHVWVSGPDVHVVWSDNRTGPDYEIYYKRSSNGGFSWGPDVRLTNAPGTKGNASISATGLIVHVVWVDHRDGGWGEIYYKASADGGVTWSPDGRLTNDPNISAWPRVWVSGPDVHVVWQDDRSGNWEIYYKRSTNGGFSWGADTRLTVASGRSEQPSISVTGQVVHVVWSDERDRNYTRVFYKASADGGLTWSPDGSMTQLPSEDPSVFVSGPDVHVVWTDSRHGNLEIYHKLSVNGGFSWGGDTRLTVNTAASRYPSVVVSGSRIHVVWTDDRNGNQEVYYKRNANYLVSVSELNSRKPEVFWLAPNYPNPFNPSTRIQYGLPEPARVQLVIYDVLGNEVKLMADKEQIAGVYEAEWDGKDHDGKDVASGIYLARLNAGSFVQMHKMILLK